MLWRSTLHRFLSSYNIALSTGVITMKVLKFALLLIAAAASALTSYSQESTDKSLSPYFFVKGDPAVDYLPLKGTRVDIAVSGVIADVSVVQTYSNEGSRPINATYVFPASTRAAVYSMRMKIGDQLIYAKIKEREQAKQEFEEAKKEGKSASLLEENRPNVFSMSLANIMPRDEIEIELRYTELLIPTDGVYEVVYPNVVGPRYASAGNDGKPVAAPYLRKGVAPTSSLHIRTRIAAGMPIRELRSMSHEISPEWHGPTVVELTLDEPNAFHGNRDFILNYRLTGDQMTSGLLLFQSADENFFLYMAQPPERIVETDIPSREYVFVVDVSGSMEGFPINTAKHLLTDLIGNLRPKDFFNVVLFSGDSTLLSPHALAANQENITLALDLLTQQRGSGGTELLSALQQAMNMPASQDASRSIVVITDGYISAESDVFDYIRGNLGNANIFSFGIGSSVNRYLVEGIAKAGMGEPFIVTSEAEAESTAVRFREYIQSPVLTDVSVHAVGFEVYDVQPGSLPDLFARRPVIVFGKWRGDIAGTFELSGRTGHGKYSQSLDVSSVQADEGNRALRYLWARSKIGELSDYGSRNVSETRVREITELGLRYNLLTPYTSFIAIREKIVNPNAPAQDVDQPLPLPAEVGNLAVGSEPEMLWLLLACGLAAVFTLVRRRLS